MQWLWNLNLWLDRRGRPFNSAKIVGPTALAALPTLHVSGVLPQLPVGCPSTLARGDGPLRLGPTRSPALRISDSAILVKDGEGVPRAGPSRPGQIFRQPYAKSSAMLAGTFTPPGPDGKGSRTPVGKPRTAPGRRRFYRVSPPSAATSSSARHLPHRASPSQVSQVGFE